MGNIKKLLAPAMVLALVSPAFGQGHTSSFPTMLLQSPKNSMLCVQMQLSAAGYNVGKPDGLFGRKTKAASLKFVDEFSYANELSELSKGNGYDWCRAIATNSPEFAEFAGISFGEFLADKSPKIFVSDNNPDKVDKALTSDGLAGYLRTLHEIAVTDSDKIFIDTRKIPVSDRGDSVVFVFNGGLRVGDLLKTSWSFRLDPDDSWFVVEYEQKVKKVDPLVPLLIVNGAAAMVHGEFLFKAFRNGKLISERLVLTNKN